MDGADIDSIREEAELSKYGTVHSQIESLRSERSAVLENKAKEVFEEVQKKIFELDEAIKTKETILEEIRVKNPKLHAEFDKLRREITESSAKASELMQQNRKQREDISHTKGNIETLQAKLKQEEAQRQEVDKKLNELRELLTDETLDDSFKIEIEARISAVERAIADQNDLKESVKRRYSVSSEVPSSPRHARKTSVNVDEEKMRIKNLEAKLLAETRNRQQLSS